MAQAMADAIGATKRQVQIWTDAGVIHCRPETDRQGRGKQRLYDRAELPIAALIAQAARFNLPIGALQLISTAIRQEATRNDLPGGRMKWLQAALRGDVPAFVTIRTGPGFPEGRFGVGLADKTQVVKIVTHSPITLVINVQDTVRRLPK